MLSRPVIVFVSGNNGSGKSTLGHVLADRLQWRHLPVEKFDQTYLDDLFTFERRWSFEAQLHFLTHKVGTINRCIADSANAFIDRSPQEDAQIFAEYFHSTGNMDTRAITTYRQVATHLLSALPPPDLFIYCFAPLEVLEQRIANRRRGYESKYPPNHLAMLDLRYRRWLEAILAKFPGKVLAVDTSHHDFRNDHAAQTQAADEVLFHLERLCTPPDDIDITTSPLFTPASLDIPYSAPCGLTGASLLSSPRAIATPIFVVPTAEMLRPPARLSRAERAEGKLRAYIAAPFTAMASTPIAVPDDSAISALPGIAFEKRAPEHGLLPDSYRRQLLALETIVKTQGFATILPHRDVNKWGDRLLSPKNALAECTQSIRRSDVFVGIPGQSFGVHYEIGVAAGIGIPIAVLYAEDTDTSFIVKGVDALPNCEILRYRDGDELRVKLTSWLRAVSRKP